MIFKLKTKIEWLFVKRVDSWAIIKVINPCIIELVSSFVKVRWGAQLIFDQDDLRLIIWFSQQVNIMVCSV